MKIPLLQLLILLPMSALAHECTNPNAPLAICQAEAEAGQPVAQVSLATKYMYGQEVPRDEEQAFSWYLKAAEQGVAPGAVAYMYATGTGVTEDYHEAAKWYAKGAEQGDAVSQLSLGMYYEHGTGVERNSEKARALYKASCEGGNHGGCDAYKSMP